MLLVRVNLGTKDGHLKNKGLASSYLSNPTCVHMVPILDEEHAIGQALPLHVLDFYFELCMLSLPYLTLVVYIHLMSRHFWCTHKSYMVR